MGHIMNLPAYAADYSFIVARHVDGAWWFWGAYHDREAAAHAAWQVGGEVFTEWCAA